MKNGLRLNGCGESVLTHWFIDLLVPRTDEPCTLEAPKT